MTDMISTLSFLATLFTAIVLAQNTTYPVIDLGYAKYRGRYNSTLDITEYLGLPFAAPPIGPLRWKAPQPYTTPKNLTNTIIDATQDGPICVQGNTYWTGRSAQFPTGSEDCLVLNVVIPGNATKYSKLPVIFQIHGGGYVEGWASIGEPYALMQHSNNAFVFVSIQYRLGAYGFLGSDKYAQEGGAPNVGLLDQRFALEWVQKHISAFGGDPAKVTIWGGSAGGGSVTSQMIMHGGVEDPPFRAAIADFPWWQQLLKEERLATQFGYLLTATNCSTLACLRHVTEDTLKAATQASYIKGYAEGSYGYGSFYYGPYVDGSVIQDWPSEEFKTGHFTKVPTFVSREGYEGYAFSNQSMTTMAEETTDISIQFPYADENFVKELYELYPREDFNSTFWQRQAWFGDFIINCPSYYIASSLATSNQPIYKFVFDAGTQIHASTGPFLGDLNYASEPGANVTLADVMKDWYVSFAIHGDPNAQSWSKVLKPTWPDYRTGEVMSVNYTQLGAVDDVWFDDDTGCKFLWEHEEVVQN
ncbi:alpha/beta-hydrolase [Trematosphaeria pertusa]|uniref:Carboxylic ester hydrolase n=1 Tax=Trematosphaeria pertusa TaxID=390896 RepID=A0A6A6I3K0_9PLEO|nr:alpha/beta-hydrolase [Trematosphaeria pertusa]KAF2244160.1 alpha/beta-hydrolase [Trematosphaeria pertusa]